jgi:hypothetical protein
VSDWFQLGDSRFEVDSASKELVSKTAQVEDIPYVDPTKLEPIERASIERAITERDQHILGLRSNVLQIQRERLALESQLSEIQADREQLRNRIREFETTRPSLDPNTVFTTFAASFDDIEEDLSAARYSIDDVDVTLKANVIQTDEGLRMHLPSLDERSATETLSEFSFRLRSSGSDTGSDAETEPPNAEYVEIPDLVGLSQAAATRRLAAADLTLGVVTVDDGSTDLPGTVIEQFPEPQMVAPPDAPVDIVVTEAAPEPATETNQKTTAETVEESTEKTDETLEESESDADSAPKSKTDQEVDRIEAESKEQLSEPVDETISKTDRSVDDKLRERLYAAGVSELTELVKLGPERLANILGYPVTEIKPLYDQLVAQYEQRSGEPNPAAETPAHPPEEPLESIDGIGPTYAGRLSDADVAGVASLAKLDPETVAKITNTSVSRSTDWIEQARRMSETK